MIRSIFIALLFLFDTVSFAASNCGKALPIDNAGFCSSFKSTAICHCTSKGLPQYICQNMPLLYKQMTTIYGSLDRACSAQKETTQADCVANWNCYKTGVAQQQVGDALVNCLSVCERF